MCNGLRIYHPNWGVNHNEWGYNGEQTSTRCVIFDDVWYFWMVKSQQSKTITYLWGVRLCIAYKNWWSMSPNLNFFDTGLCFCTLYVLLMLETLVKYPACMDGYNIFEYLTCFQWCRRISEFHNKNWRLWTSKHGDGKQQNCWFCP